jgi:hypothetical protein
METARWAKLFGWLPEAIGPETVAVFAVFVVVLAALLALMWHVFRRRH